MLSSLIASFIVTRGFLQHLTAAVFCLSKMSIQFKRTL
eukprot:UN14930